MDYCKFCGTLRAKQTVYKFKRERPIMYGEEAEKLQEYRAALMTRSWFKGDKKHSTWQFDYGSCDRGYKLNYCPECGKKL